MDICRIHSFVCTENVIDHSSQVEDILQDDQIPNSSITSTPGSSSEFISAKIASLTIIGTRPFVWQPPEV
jgi:hypothetical protein